MQAGAVFLSVLLFIGAHAQGWGDEPTSDYQPRTYGEGSGEQTGDGSGLQIDQDCSNKEDGLYEIAGCSPQFLTCSGGIARIMDCPADLIYDARIVACEYAAQVPGCQAGPASDAPVTVTEAAKTTTAVSESAYITSETTSASSEVETTSSSDLPETSPRTVDRSCQKDGFYSYGECSDSYTACTNGYSIQMTCPSNLAFDEARQLCDYPHAVPECNTHNGGEESGSGEETTSTPEDTTSEEASGDDVLVGEDRTTSDDVHRTYENTEAPTTDSYEETTVEETTPGFDESSGDQTTEAYEVTTTEESTTAAYDVETTEEVTETPTESYPEETTPIYAVPTVEDTTPAPSNDEAVTEARSVYEAQDSAPQCVDGATQIEPCSPVYNNCVNGQEAVFTCQTGTLFSQEHSSCVPVSQLPQCQPDIPY